MRDSRTPRRQSHDELDDDGRVLLIKAYVTPDIKQLMSTCILNRGAIHRIAKAITKNAALDKTRYEFDETTGLLKKHTSLDLIYIEAYMLLSRSLEGKNLDYLADLTGEEMYASDYENDLQARLRQI